MALPPLMRQSLVEYILLRLLKKSIVTFHDKWHKYIFLHSKIFVYLVYKKCKYLQHLRS